MASGMKPISHFWRRIEPERAFNTGCGTMQTRPRCAPPTFTYIRQSNGQTSRKKMKHIHAHVFLVESELHDQGLQNDDSWSKYSRRFALFALKTFGYFFTGHEKWGDSQFLVLFCFVFLENSEDSQTLCQHSHLATVGSLWSVAAFLVGVCSLPLATVDGISLISTSDLLHWSLLPAWTLQGFFFILVPAYVSNGIS